LLLFKGPSATRGYFRNPEATAKLIRDGWHDTGDRAYLAGGDIHLTGRVKDLIIRGGRNIYPYELEKAVGEIPGIRKGCVAAFAAIDERTGSERLVVVAETRERDPSRRSELEQEVRERAGDIVGVPPDEVLLAPPRAVLKTSSGKLRRGDVRERYLVGTLTAGPPSPLRQMARLALSGAGAATARLVRRVPASLYAAYAWTLFAVIAPVVWAGIMIAPKPDQRWRVARLGIRWLRRLAFMRIEVAGAEHIPPPQAHFVLAANHQSYMDALVLIEAISHPMGFIAKRELLDTPLVGPLLTRLDTVFVERFDMRRGAAESHRFDAALAGGRVLAFFPEGTFRDEPGLLSFRMGAFVAAAQAGVPVLPVALQGTRALMRGDSFFPQPGRAKVFIGAPLPPRGGDWHAAVTLRDATRTFILEHCGEPDLDG
jgi:1-acyl-sn-glycerol-3-phosphate acyltransferase